MPRKIDFRLIGLILLSLADDAVILFIVGIVLSLLGISIPWWVWLILVAIIVAITTLIYRVLRQSPQLGFTDMVGLVGVTTEPVGRKGTIRIEGELWFARTRGEQIPAGVEVRVVEQTGLKLTVVPGAKPG